MRPTPVLWAFLHTHPTGSWAALREVRAELPCQTCLEHMDAFVRQYPPAFGARWFAWTVTFHNDVNRRLGKPVWSLEEAARAWGRIVIL